MNTRTSFHKVIQDLLTISQDRSATRGELAARLETELYNAYVAGQEQRALGDVGMLKLPWPPTSPPGRLVKKTDTVAAPRLVLRFRTLAKAKRAWEILWLLSSALKLFPADFWVHYNSDCPREITLGLGEWPEHKDPYSTIRVGPRG